MAEGLAQLTGRSHADFVNMCMPTGSKPAPLARSTLNNHCLTSILDKSTHETTGLPRDAGDRWLSYARDFTTFRKEQHRPSLRDGAEVAPASFVLEGVLSLTDKSKAYNLHPCAAVRKRWDADIDEFLNSLDVDTQDTAWLTESIACASNGKECPNPQCTCHGQRQDLWEQGGWPLQYNTVHGSGIDAHLPARSPAAEGYDPLRAGAADDHWHANGVQLPPSPNMHMSPEDSPGNAMLTLGPSDTQIAPCVPGLSSAHARLPGVVPLHTSVQLKARARGLDPARDLVHQAQLGVGGDLTVAGHSAAMAGQLSTHQHMQIGWPEGDVGTSSARPRPVYEGNLLQHSLIAHSHAAEYPSSMTGTQQQTAPGYMKKTMLGTAVNLASHTICSPAPQRHPIAATLRAPSRCNAVPLDHCPPSGQHHAPVEPLWSAAGSACQQPCPNPVEPPPCDDVEQQTRQQTQHDSLEPLLPQNEQLAPHESLSTSEHGHRDCYQPTAGHSGPQVKHEVQQLHGPHNRADEHDNRAILAPIAVHVRRSSGEPSSQLNPFIKGVSENRAVTTFTELQTIVKLEKEPSVDYDASPRAEATPDQCGKKSNTASGSMALHRSPVGPAHKDSAPASSSLTTKKPAESTVPAKGTGSAGRSGGRQIALPLQHVEVHGAPAAAMRGRRQAGRVSVQPVGDRAAKTKASQRIQSSVSSEPEVSSDEEDSDVCESPCWQQPQSARGRRKAGQHLKVLVKTEEVAVKPAPKASSGRKKKREVPASADVSGKDDAKKYRGVTRKINGRFEAQLHDHTARQSGSGKGDQVYLGVYVGAVKAAMAYDRAALRLFGKDAVLNFPLSLYMGPEEVKLREVMTKRQYVAHIKSRSDADRGMSGYHGVAKRKSDRWQSRITGVACFGTFSNAEDAARAYDLASIHLDGEDAVLNYPLPEYWDFKTKSLKADLPWKVPESVLNAPPSTARRKRPRGKSKKASAVKGDSEEEVLVTTSRSSKARRKGERAQGSAGDKKR